MKVNKPGGARRGGEAFDRWYAERFADRWEELRSALLDDETRRHYRIASGAGAGYLIDPASVAAARMLPVADASRIVDLCAAPGGKALVLAGRMGSAAHLVANERSSARRRRLIAVLEEFLASEVRERVDVTAHDAVRWGVVQPESADAVLADVPCSSERHVLGDAAALAQWTSARVRRLVATQRGILGAALDAVKPGGWVLYSTCALSPEENDQVVARMSGRREGISVCTPSPIEFAGVTDDLFSASALEATEFGLQILPDRERGVGPMYMALLHRCAPASLAEQARRT